MNMVLKSSVLLAAAGLALAAPGAIGAPVDDARLLAAADDAANWLTYGRDYTNQRYSQLDQINRDTVAGLAPAWVHQTGVPGTFQTQLLVADGQMVLTTPHNHVTALDAKTGAVLWQYKHVKRVEKTRAGPSNRGPAIGYGKVFQATNDGRVIALDRTTGELVWDSLLATPAPGEVEAMAAFGPEAQQAFIAGIDSFPAKMPPLVANGKVIAGVISAGYGIYHDLAATMGFAGPEAVNTMFGRRGYLAAFDAETGKELWRFHTTKAEGWEGDFSETTADGVPMERNIAAEKAAAAKYPDAWRTGGGSTWMTPAFDPELGLIYLGTGNASPADADIMRPGDNLYASSLVALDIETGEVRWHQQLVPHDLWGYDVANPPILFDVPSGYKAAAVVGVAAKNGWFYAFRRDTGQLMFKSEPFVPQQNLFARGTVDGLVFAPGSFGGAAWSPSAYHPGTGFVYVPAIHRPAKLFEKTVTDESSGETISFMLTEYENGLERAGTLSAIDTRAAGKIEWQVKTDQPLVGGVLTTAGDLLFVGEGSGRFAALDVETGERLWAFMCDAGANAPPVTYAVDGRQYVAIAAGGSRFFDFPTGDYVYAFALPE